MTDIRARIAQVLPGAAQNCDVTVHLTAAEAYPALEEAFLNAETEIWASFLVFDLQTRLRSKAAQTIGETWFDLLVHVLRRGVLVNFVISDVDPIGRPEMHRDATRSLRRFCAAAEIAGPKTRLKVAAARHPACTGAGIRLLIWPYIQKKLRAQAKQLNNMPPAHRSAALRDLPGLVPYLRARPDGSLAPRLRVLPSLFPAVHHQKMAVIDRRLLYIGGLDLDESRYDTPEHQRPGSQTWHDLQLMMTGPAVAEAQTHLEEFRAVANGDTPPSPHRHVLTTISSKRAFDTFCFGPKRSVFQIRTAHTALAQQATQLIYLETQYFRDRRFAKDLAARAKVEPNLTMILILPAAPDDVAFEGNRSPDARFGEFTQARSLKIIRRAFGPRLFVGSPAQSRRAPAPDERKPNSERRDQLMNAPLVYVHAKVSIFDDAAAIVSSANLNGRSFFWDTEAGVHLSERCDVENLRQRVMAHWLPKSAGPAAYALPTAAASWAKIARHNARMPPEAREGFLLPHDFAAAEAFGHDLPFVPDEMV
jgi:phosphatidylserine/phosphatidylglycerophosphate/cardiolipin synthase-like enzyme